jgi:hypothetical protein
VVTGWVPRQRDGWMWDLTVPGGGDHDFYIDTTAADVLVHNCSDPVPDPEPVYKPSGAPNRDSPWYVSYRDAEGNIQTVGNEDGVHAEVAFSRWSRGLR